MRPPPETDSAPHSRNEAAPPWLWALRLLALLTTALAIALPIIAAFWLVVFLISAAALFLYLITFGGIHFNVDHVFAAFSRSAGLLAFVYLIVMALIGWGLWRATARVASWTIVGTTLPLLGAWLLDHDILSLFRSLLPS